MGAVLGPDEGLWLQLWRLIHCVMRTAGNGITFAEGREDNAVTPDHSLAANRTRPCQAVSASAFCCTTLPTHSTNHPLPFPPVHQPRRAPSGEGLGVRGLHSTSIWQVSMNTSLVHEAAWVPSLALFGEYARACTAAWFIADCILLC